MLGWGSVEVAARERVKIISTYSPFLRLSRRGFTLSTRLCEKLANANSSEERMSRLRKDTQL
jgi:hypothetical protein